MNPKARPKAYGEVSVPSDVPDIELLQDDDGEPSASDLNEDGSNEEPEGENVSSEDGEEDDDASDEGNEDEDEEEIDELEDDDSIGEEENDSDDSDNDDEATQYDYDSDVRDMEETDVNVDSSKFSAEKMANKNSDEDDDNVDAQSNSDDDNVENKDGINTKSKKRKFVDYIGQLNASESSLRALKKLAMAKAAQKASDETDGILSNEDFQRIKELKV